MTYPYGMRNAPKVGNGLGGLPRREEQPVTSVAGDPLWGNVSLLLHADDNLLDSGPLKLSTVAVGNAAVSGVDKAFGSGAIYLDGNGDFIQLPANTNINVFEGDFTIECFIKRTAYIYQHDCIFTLTTTHEWKESPLGAMNGLGFTCGSLLTLGDPSDYSMEVPLNTWLHVACVRKSGVVTVYLAGQPVISVTQGAVLGHALCTPGIGLLDKYSGSHRRFFKGYIDEFRITNGAARYSGAFSPPGKPFLDY